MKTIFLSLSLLSALPISADTLLSPRMQFLKSELKRVLIANPTYMGIKSQYIDEGWGTFCQKSTDWWFSWEGKIGEVEVTLAPDHSKIQMNMQFTGSSVQGAGFRTGGILCMPMGGMGRASFADVRLAMSITRGENESQKPLVHLESLALSGLRLDRVDLSVPFFNIRNGTAPDWLNQFIEKNSNRLIGKILGSSLSRRIDAKLSDVLAEMIGNFDGLGALPPEKFTIQRPL